MGGQTASSIIISRLFIVRYESPYTGEFNLTCPVLFRISFPVQRYEVRDGITQFRLFKRPRCRIRGSVQLPLTAVSNSSSLSNVKYRFPSPFILTSGKLDRLKSTFLTLAFKMEISFSSIAISPDRIKRAWSTISSNDGASDDPKSARSASAPSLFRFG